MFDKLFSTEFLLLFGFYNSLSLCITESNVFDKNLHSINYTWYLLSYATKLNIHVIWYPCDWVTHDLVDGCINYNTDHIVYSISLFSQYNGNQSNKWLLRMLSEQVGHDSNINIESMTSLIVVAWSYIVLSRVYTNVVRIGISKKWVNRRYANIDQRLGCV